MLLKAKWVKYVATFLAGIALSVCIFEFVIVPNARAGLSKSLDRANTALVKSQDDYRQLSEANSGLQQKLADANRLTQQQADTIATLSNQLNAGQQIIAGIQQTVASSGGNIFETATAIASGFDKLYESYFGRQASSANP